jgi:excisionase family DNA binding protein
MAQRLGIGRSTLHGLIQREGLPAHRLSGGEGRRGIVLFDPVEVDEWVRGRRERQIQGLLDGTRYQRRHMKD